MTHPSKNQRFLTHHTSWRSRQPKGYESDPGGGHPKETRLRRVVQRDSNEILPKETPTKLSPKRLKFIQRYLRWSKETSSEETLSKGAVHIWRQMLGGGRGLAKIWWYLMRGGGGVKQNLTSDVEKVPLSKTRKIWPKKTEFVSEIKLF